MSKTIAVIGLGTMGAGIAQTFAKAGHRVRGFDVTPRAVDGVDVRPTEAAAVEGADLVIEAVAEQLTLKQELFARLEPLVSPNAILATNTSSLKLADVMANVKRQDRCVVMHWFNPPHVVPVVEVVPGPQTAPATVDVAVELLRHAGKRPVRLNREIPGFIVNRVQVAMYREVWSLLQQGIATAEDIDAAISGSMGLRLAAGGPLEIADFGGLDIWRSVFSNLAPQIESGTQLPAKLADAVAQGNLGAKTGRGVYDYAGVDMAKRRAAREARLAAILRALDELQAN